MLSLTFQSLKSDSLDNISTGTPGLILHVLYWRRVLVIHFHKVMIFVLFILLLKMIIKVYIASINNGTTSLIL